MQNRKKTFFYTFIEKNKMFVLFLLVLSYPHLWITWILSRDTSWTPNIIIKEKWKEMFDA